MTTIQVVKIQKEENSNWEKAIELNIDDFDAINVIIDCNGLTLDEFYDIERPKNSKLLPIPSFP